MRLPPLQPLPACFLQFKSGLSGDARKQFDQWANAAVGIHNRNKHKLNSPHNINVL